MPVNNSSKYLAIVYARFGASRLPGKVMRRLGGNTILDICLDKLATVKDLLPVVATTTNPLDNAIADFCLARGTQLVRGEEQDVAARTRHCLEEFSCQAFFRINADSPFLQPDLLRKAMTVYQSGIDLVTNVRRRTFPYGIAVELIGAKSFIDHVDRFSESDREHITQYFYRNSADFAIRDIVNTHDLSSSRFVLDTEDDWQRITKLYALDNNVFTYSPEQLIAINRQLQ